MYIKVQNRFGQKDNKLCREFILDLDEESISFMLKYLSSNDVVDCISRYKVNAIEIIDCIGKVIAYCGGEKAAKILMEFLSSCDEGTINKIKDELYLIGLRAYYRKMVKNFLRIK